MARLLIVDDDPDQVDIRRLIMEAAGHEVSVAGSVSAALTQFDRGHPDVVLMDLRLPRTEDGQGLIRALRSRDAGVRIIVFSGWPGNLGGLPEGDMVDHFVRKPARSQRLLSLIDKLA